MEVGFQKHKMSVVELIKIKKEGKKIKILMYNLLFVVVSLSLL